MLSNLILNNTDIQVGGLYKHFKGNKYWVLGIGYMYESKDKYVIYTENWKKAFENLAFSDGFICRDSETDRLYDISLIRENKINSWRITPLIYWNENINYDAWVRPYESFVSILENELPRFELCQLNP